MDGATRELVRNRAANRCEYCGLHQDQSPLAPLHVEHVIARKHGGGDAPDNLALACIDCNLHKGSNLTGYDPETSQLTELFHPRKQRWSEHFEWQGIHIAGRTAVGRTTVRVLAMNSEEQIQLRMVQRDT